MWSIDERIMYQDSTSTKAKLFYGYVVRRIVYGQKKVLFFGLLWLLPNFMLRLRDMFILIFTGVAHLILYFAMKFKFIFLI